MPALDLALGLGMIRRSAHMFHSAIVELFGQIAGYVAGAIVAEQSRLVLDMGGGAQGSDDPQDRWNGCEGLVTP